ncbi:RluA family pseudouridine synthase [Undibacter mobilis]|uniref:RluA family pseudouridine synthase n=1 Tax=Undibacter mobilis TaxID=2292256 RepID=UPI001FE08015|nr:RluA family pseudouridine synthase [Undibacter mobilis]
MSLARHPEARGAKSASARVFDEPRRRLAKGDGVRRSEGTRPSSEGRLRRPPRDEGERPPRVTLRHEPEQPLRKAEPEISPALAAATKVQTVTVTPDENGMRVDRFFEARFPGLSFSHIQRIVRKGEVRVNGKRTETKSRLEAGQEIRIPPLQLAAPRVREDSPQVLKDREYLRSITLAEDDDVLVLNKPMGLAVQGGSGTTRHVDGLLEALRGPGVDAQRPRLVHRLDKDTAGCLLVAKTRFAAAALAKTFRTRSARKIYWALVAGVPKPKQGRISTYLVKQEMEEDSFMRVAKHGEKDAVHAVTYYAVVETSAQKLAWVSLKPVTGRTHQLRAHMAHVGSPIVGDPKYFNIENWELPGGIQNKLHLLARRIVVPHPRGGTIDVSAPLPPHMQQSWNLLGLDAERFDPIVDAPDED